MFLHWSSANWIMVYQMDWKDLLLSFLFYLKIQMYLWQLTESRLVYVWMEQSECVTLCTKPALISEVKKRPFWLICLSGARLQSRQKPQHWHNQWKVQESRCKKIKKMKKVFCAQVYVSHTLTPAFTDLSVSFKGGISFRESASQPSGGINPVLLLCSVTRCNSRSAPLLCKNRFLTGRMLSVNLKGE